MDECAHARCRVRDLRSASSDPAGRARGPSVGQTAPRAPGDRGRLASQGEGSILATTITPPQHIATASPGGRGFDNMISKYQCKQWKRLILHELSEKIDF